ncbi:hypothetical protein J1C56_23890 [Aminobacter anthyllidis]|uniref:Uncharacterized protein n=1 Tax=Aminobacter anthyllidis TaxID=1035067 RepID=A0A9X1AFA7_9HYPH|nr:hypothetical protein [Aminobacter anthyllidis]MBT1158623.1 hypothetical protein [Aminobacter anthyllidis]
MPAPQRARRRGKVSIQGVPKLQRFAAEHHPNLVSKHIGTVTLVGPAQVLAAQQRTAYKAPLCWGEDTTAVLLKVLSYSSAAVDRLINDGVFSEPIRNNCELQNPANMPAAPA